MRTGDILRLSLAALWRQRGRTLLTMSGVVIGTFALVVIIALGEGFQAAIIEQFDRGNQLRQILVNPGFGAEAAAPDDVSDILVAGEMTDDKRRRVRKTLLSRRGMGNPQQKKTVLLTEDRLAEIRSLPGVESVTPMIQDRYRVSLALGENARRLIATAPPAAPPSVSENSNTVAPTLSLDQAVEVVSIGASPDNSRFAGRIVAGTYLTAADAPEIVVHEYLLYRWGITTDEQVASVIGSTLTVEYTPPLDSGSAGLAMAAEFLGLTETEKATLRGLTERLRNQPLNVLAALAALKLTPQETALLGQLGRRFGPPGRPASEAKSDAGSDQPNPAAEGPAANPAAAERLAALLKSPGDAVPLFRESFRVVGVIREFMEDDDVNVFEAGMSLHADVFMPLAIAEALYKRLPANVANGYASLIVTADSESTAREVARSIRQMGLMAISMGVIVEKVKTALTIVTSLVAFLGAIALAVAALGIVNTMIMSVMERTREIGIMKAIGARDAQVQVLFFAESAMIGVLGGLLGATLGWVVGFPGDALGRAFIEQKTHMPYRGTLLLYPWWLMVGAVGFAGVMSVLAAIYPARRAARVDPIQALRHE